MKTILLIGGGGHCRSVIDVVETEGRFKIVGIIRPESEGMEPVLTYPILGDDTRLPELVAQTPHVLIAVGQIKSPTPRQTIFRSLKALDAVFPVVVSPKAYVSKHASLGEGTLVMHGALVNAGARLGCNGIINSLALIEHDAVIGDHCHISTAARVNGGVIVEDGCFIGSGAIVREGVKIRSNSVIGAGCVVTRDVEPNTFMPNTFMKVST